MIAEKVFAEGVAKEITEYLSPEYADVKCQVVESRKNNGVSLVGLRFARPGQNIAPVIYVESFYDDIKHGAPIEKIMADIAEAAEGCLEMREIQGLKENSMDYGRIKECLSLRMINTKANRRELAGMPHQNVEDLSLVPVFSFPLDGTGQIGTVKVTNELAGLWGVGTETIFRQAWENMEKKDSPVLQSMDVTIRSALGGKDSGENLLAGDGEAIPEPEMLYTLSNKEGCYGSAVLACPGVMEKIDGMFPDGFFIIPSSVHEVLIAPDRGKMEPHALGEMVRGINRDCVDRQEVLSDRVYRYDRKKGKIQQVPESIEKQRGMER